MTRLASVRDFTWHPGVMRRTAGIKFLHENWWLALPYLVVAFGLLNYMQIRATSDQQFWSVFLIMSLPIALYSVLCFVTGAFLIDAPGPI